MDPLNCLLFKGYSCNFENAKICGFTNVHGNDTFDWTRFGGRTGSTYTGPTSDHTYGTARGWVFIIVLPIILVLLHSSFSFHYLFFFVGRIVTILIKLERRNLSNSN